jgi:class 3 adenylate cyclase/methyl-accepting chemotaxis protein
MRLIDFFRRRLQVKVISLIVVILILGFGVLVMLNIQRESNALIAKNRETSRLLASTIVESIENGMLEARPDIIRMLIADLKTNLQDIKQLDVFRRNGVEAFSDLSTFQEVDDTYGLEKAVRERIVKMQREPGKTLSHELFTQAVDTLQPQAYIEEGDQGRLYTLFYPLENRQTCHACHGVDHRTRGVIRLSLSLNPLDQELRINRNQQASLAALTIVGAVGCLVVLMRQVVLKPLQKVAETAQRIGRGELAAQVAVQTPDEIGHLGLVINEMSQRLQSAHNDLAAKNTELQDALQNLQESLRKVALLEQVKGELTKFVPESVTRLLEQNPNAQELEKREADVSVLFLDVEGYTRLSEQLPPQRLNRLIQDYFSSFLEIIRANHGDINETAGDGLMVIFQSEEGAGRHALNAANAAVQIEHKLADLNQEFAGVYPPVAVHVGINSGKAFVGATKLSAAGGGRWTFTASGPTTNLAARIAALTKGGEIKVGPETAERIRKDFVLEDTGQHELKNVSAPVQVFRLVPPGVYSQVTL